MPRRKPGLHKNLSDILDGARIPEEARDRRTGEDDPPARAPEVQQDVRSRAADNLVPPGPEHMGPRWVVGDEAKQREKKPRGLFGVLRRIGRLVAGTEPEDL